MKDDYDSEEFGSEELELEDDYSEETGEDIISEIVEIEDDYVEEDIDEEEENEEVVESKRHVSRDRNRYQKYKNISCPHCRRNFHADKIRYTHIRSAIIYSCPLCKTILSINNKQHRWRGPQRSNDD